MSSIKMVPTKESKALKLAQEYAGSRPSAEELDLVEQINTATGFMDSLREEYREICRKDSVSGYKKEGFTRWEDTPQTDLDIVRQFEALDSLCRALGDRLSRMWLFKTQNRSVPRFKKPSRKKRGR